MPKNKKSTAALDEAKLFAELPLILERCNKLREAHGRLRGMTVAQRFEYLDGGMKLLRELLDVQTKCLAWLSIEHVANPDWDPFAAWSLAAKAETS